MGPTQCALCALVMAVSSTWCIMQEGTACITRAHVKYTAYHETNVVDPLHAYALQFAERCATQPSVKCEYALEISLHGELMLMLLPTVPWDACMELQAPGGKSVWQQLVDVCEQNPATVVWRERLQAVRDELEEEVQEVQDANAELVQHNEQLQLRVAQLEKQLMAASGVAMCKP